VASIVYVGALVLLECAPSPGTSVLMQACSLFLDRMFWITAGRV
jgi:hypothetical protein